MNVNEIRGYIFGGFALVCFIGRSLGSAMMWGYYSEFYFTLLMIMAVGFGLLAVVCFAKAYSEAKYPGGAGKPEAVKQNYRVGKAWTEFNLFQLRMDKVNVQQKLDGLTCEAMFTAENWRTELKNGGNQMHIAFAAEAETGKENLTELSMVNKEITIEAGKQHQIPLAFTVPDNTERVLINCTAIFDENDAVYKSKFEFYPAHYTR